MAPPKREIRTGPRARTAVSAAALQAASGPGVSIDTPAFETELNAAAPGGRRSEGEATAMDETTRTQPDATGEPQAGQGAAQQSSGTAAEAGPPGDAGSAPGPRPENRSGPAEAQAGVRLLASLGQKALESARNNTNAAFDHAASLLAARTMADAIELNTAFARRQVEAAAQQARELTDLVRTAALDQTGPLRAPFEAVFKRQD